MGSRPKQPPVNAETRERRAQPDQQAVEKAAAITHLGGLRQP
jgi:hypothetical protein